MRGIRIHFCILFIAIAVGTVYAQPDTLWSRTIGDGPTFYGATELSNGDIAAVGVANGDAWQPDVFLARVSSLGEIRWTRSYPMLGSSESARAGVELSNGNLVLVGDLSGGPYPNSVFLLCVNANGDSLWSRSYAGGGQTEGLDATATPDGGLAIIGYALQADSQHSDLWLLKCTANGDTLWTRKLGGTATDTGSRILCNPDGTLILGGSTKSQGNGDFDLWFQQVDANGEIQSSRTCGTYSPDRCYAMAATDSYIYQGGYVLYGSDKDGLVARLNRDGDSLWASTLTHGLSDEEIRGLLPRADGAVLCAGWSGISPLQKPWLVEVRPDGSIGYNHVDSTWSKGWYYDIVPLRADGDGVIVGSVVGMDGIRHGYLLRIAPPTGITGTVLQTGSGLPAAQVTVRALEYTSYTRTSDDGRYTLVAPPGTYTIVTSSPCYSADSAYDVTVTDTLVVVNLEVGSPHYGCDLTSINVDVHNHVAMDVPLVIHNLGNGAMAFRVTTQTQIPPTNWLSVEPASGTVSAGESLALQVQVLADTLDDHIYDFIGSVTVHAGACPDSVDTIPVFATVLEANDPSPVVREFALSSVYPNPFNSRTTISFAVPRAGHVRVTVCDILGREAARLVDRTVEPGLHSVHFDGANLGSGVYFVRMDAEGFAATKKIVLMK